MGPYVLGDHQRPAVPHELPETGLLGSPYGRSGDNTRATVPDAFRAA